MTAWAGPGQESLVRKSKRDVRRKGVARGFRPPAPRPGRSRAEPARPRRRRWRGAWRGRPGGRRRRRAGLAPPAPPSGEVAGAPIYLGGDFHEVLPFFHGCYCFDISLAPRRELARNMPLRLAEDVVDALREGCSAETGSRDAVLPAGDATTAISHSEASGHEENSATDVGSLLVYGCLWQAQWH